MTQGFPSGAVVKNPPAIADVGLIRWSRRSPEEGNSNPLHHSCLGNPGGRGAWWAAVHGVARVRTESDVTEHTRKNDSSRTTTASPSFLKQLKEKNVFGCAGSRGHQDLQFALRHEGALVSACGIWSSDQGSNRGL